jgi:hypothetical protein
MREKGKSLPLVEEKKFKKKSIRKKWKRIK